MDHSETYARLRDAVNEELDKCFTGGGALTDAMRYSLLAGGKRIRPVLLLAFCEMAGGSAAEALPAACGLEMLHTYSLIHDDLPCMDDDDLRRGRPTCHKVFGETLAVLAGDALQASAFACVLSGTAPGDRLAAMAKTLADAAGERGMCGGQALDTAPETAPKTENDLLVIHALKTGALLRAACVMGVQCAGGDVHMIEAAAAYAEHLGLAFQIRDDVLDEISTTEMLGKPAGSDAGEGKTTFASLLGTGECSRLVEKHTDEAIRSLDGAFGDTSFAEWLARELASRQK
ncbi:MAG: polyprenyl synthetase family protein [Oscillospiraceae bacterium]|nr:polyprenyl synthetase family protein [Oscillospiraceae bacterium]